MNRLHDWLELWQDDFPVIAMAIGLVVVFMAIGFSMLNARKPGAPCEQLGDMRVADLPARCAQHWRIR